jgi:thiamine biosynthesis lipoprotein
MPLVETLPVGPDTAQWSVWSTVARVVVTDPTLIDRAHSLVETELAAIDRAASRFRPDSEISQLRSASGSPVRVSPLLAEMIDVALRAARFTDGDVDPTIGNALVALGYDRTFSALPADVPAAAHPGRIVVATRPSWRSVHLSGNVVTLPAGVLLDLGATAKAYAADRCARLVAESLDTGVMVALGGDIATAGPAPANGWQVLVQDGPGEPASQISVPAGTAVATSSTRSRRWRSGGALQHHVLDPRTCRPANTVWRTASAAAFSCVDANIVTTASLIRGQNAVPWIGSLRLPARLVTASGDVLRLGGWPQGGPR